MPTFIKVRGYEATIERPGRGYVTVRIAHTDIIVSESMSWEREAEIMKLGKDHIMAWDTEMDRLEAAAIKQVRAMAKKLPKRKS